MRRKEPCRECATGTACADHSFDPIAELSRLRAENERLKEDVLAEHQAAVDMFGKYDECRDKLQQSEAACAIYRGALEDLAAPCTRADYTAAKLDEIVMKIASDALSLPPSALLERVRGYEETLEWIAGGCLVPPDGGDPRLEDAVKEAQKTLAAAKEGGTVGK